MSTLPERLAAGLAALSPHDLPTVEAFRALYHPDVEFRDPVQSLRGLEAFIAMNYRLLRRSKELSFEIHRTSGDDALCFLVWTARFVPKFGPRMEVEGVSELEAKDGLVVRHRDYWDLGELAASSIPGGRRILAAILRPFA